MVVVHVRFLFSKGSMQVSITTRIGWASSTWLGVLNDMVGQLGGISSRLLMWGVIKPVAMIPSSAETAPFLAVPGPLSASPGPEMAAPVPESAAHGPSVAAVGPDGVDEFLLQTAETMSRTFCGLTARALCLWQGGVYNMVKLLSEDPALQQEAIQRAQLLFPRILALEELMSSGQCPVGVKLFADRFLWIEGVAYRELLGMLSEGHVEFAKVYAWRIHGSVHHEKGPREHKSTPLNTHDIAPHGTARSPPHLGVGSTPSEAKIQHMPLRSQSPLLTFAPTDFPFTKTNSLSCHLPYPPSPPTALPTTALPFNLTRTIASPFLFVLFEESRTSSSLCAA